MHECIGSDVLEPANYKLDTALVFISSAGEDMEKLQKGQIHSTMGRKEQDNQQIISISL